MPNKIFLSQNTFLVAQTGHIGVIFSSFNIYRSFIVHFFTTNCQYIGRSGCVLGEFFTSHKILFHRITVCPLCFVGGQDMVVGIATCCWMDIQASDPGACEGFSLHIHPAQP
jgi:hypothetical protein